MWPRVVLLVALVAGCAKEGTDLRTWTLAVGDTRTEVTLPASLRDELPAGELAYTLSTEVMLREDQRGRALALVLDCFHAAISVAADGEPLATTPSAAAGAWRFAIPARLTEDGRVAVVMAVHRTAEANLGFGVVPRLTDDPRGDPRSRGIVMFNQYSAIAALCFLGLLAVLYTTLALLERGRPEYISLVAYSLTASATPLLQLGAFHALFGSFGTQVSAMVITAASLSGLYFIHHALELGPLHRRWLIVLGTYAALTPFSVLSTSATLAVAAGLMLVFVATGAYGILRLAPLARRSTHAVDARLMLIPYIVIAILLVPTLHYGITGRSTTAGFHPMSAAVALQAAVQALILARHHVARQRAIETANTELQRQVAERSRELGDALARLGQSPSRPLGTGRVIDERYRVVATLGSGGMGDVFEVERLSDKKRLALKTLRGKSDRDLLARFAREAQLAAELDHPNLVPVVDVGITDGGLYLVMPLVDGGSLEGERARFGDRAWALPIISQVAAGLAALHAKGIIHRDLKPGNVLLAGGVAQIADFGLASLASASAPPAAAETADGKGRLAHAETVQAIAAGGEDTITGVLNRGAAPAPALTRIGDVFGTPPYMAPELERGVHAVQPSSDVFAIGLIAYELLTGRKAFAEPPLMLRMAGKPIPPPDTAGVPDVIARCLALDPTQRPTAAELAEGIA